MLLGILAATVFLWRWWRTYCVPEGDFTLHWIFGRRFLAGGLPVRGRHAHPYPPFWAMASSLLTIGPMARMRIILYPFGLVPLIALLWILQRGSSRTGPLIAGRPPGHSPWRLLLSSRFLIRELPECWRQPDHGRPGLERRLRLDPEARRPGRTRHRPGRPR